MAFLRTINNSITGNEESKKYLTKHYFSFLLKKFNQECANKEISTRRKRKILFQYVILLSEIMKVNYPFNKEQKFQIFENLLLNLYNNEEEEEEEGEEEKNNIDNVTTWIIPLIMILMERKNRKDMEEFIIHCIKKGKFKILINLMDIMDSKTKDGVFNSFEEEENIEAIEFLGLLIIKIMKYYLFRNFEDDKENEEIENLDKIEKHLRIMKEKEKEIVLIGIKCLSEITTCEKVKNKLEEKGSLIKTIGRYLGIKNKIKKELSYPTEFLSYLIRILGNICYHNKVNQDLMRTYGVIPLIIGNTGINRDDVKKDPFKREICIFCIKNLTEANIENNKYISTLVYGKDGKEGNFPSAKGIVNKIKQ